jgi:hypothetical protein
VVVPRLQAINKEEQQVRNLVVVAQHLEMRMEPLQDQQQQLLLMDLELLRQEEQWSLLMGPARDVIVGKALEAVVGLEELEEGGALILMVVDMGKQVPEPVFQVMAQLQVDIHRTWWRLKCEQVVLKQFWMKSL